MNKTVDDHWIVDEEGVICKDCGEDVYHCNCAIEKLIEGKDDNSR